MSPPDAVLALALHREFARMDDLAHGAPRRSDALASYAEALEAELWALREARLTALRSHSEHHRLTREHGCRTGGHWTCGSSRPPPHRRSSRVPSP